jgi:sugar phosphate isomerase/epimerase
MIQAAGEAGFDCVSLWFPPPGIYPSALVTPEAAPECERLLSALGVQLYSLEAFALVSEAAVETYRPALELGARLGGRMALVYHVGVEDKRQAADLLAHFAETAAEFGLATCLEPIVSGATSTLAQARDLIRLSGAEVRILFDTWHLMRSGGGIEELRAIDPELIGYVQINDGLLVNPPQDILAEVKGERLYIGTGEFPLVELMSIVRRDVPWGIETPSLSRVQAGMSAATQAREAMAAMQGLLDRIDR